MLTVLLTLHSDLKIFFCFGFALVHLRLVSVISVEAREDMVCSANEQKVFQNLIKIFTKVQERFSQ
jgi:hypothetical protein